MEEQHSRRRRTQEKRFHYRADSSGTILYFRGFQGHSGRNFIDPSIQDNLLIPENFFEYICHVGCAHHQFRIDTGRTTFEQQTVFFLPVDVMDKNHKNLDTIDFGSAACYIIHAESMEETSEYCVSGRHQFCSEERIEVLSDTIECYHPSRNTSSLLYSKSC